MQWGSKIEEDETKVSVGNDTHYITKDVDVKCWKNIPSEHEDSSPIKVAAAGIWKVVK